MKEDRREKIRKMLNDMGPKAVYWLDQMLDGPQTTENTRMAIANLIIERALGKVEAKVNLETNQENIENAEAVLMAMVREVQKNGELRPDWEYNPDEEEEEEEGDSED